MKAKFHAIVAVASLIAAASCTGDDLSLIDGDDGWSARRARLAITVVQETESGPTRSEIEVVVLEESVRNECIGLRDQSTPAAHSGCSDLSEMGPSDTCRIATCRSSLALCMGHRLRELAELVTATDVGPYTVVPQDMASRAALNERAMDLASYSLTMAGENLRAGTYLPGSTTQTYSADATVARCLPANMAKDPGGGLTHGASLAFDLAEATHLVDEAAHAAVEANVAVADASFSETPSRGEASRAAWTAPVLSRVHAAALLLGEPSKVLPPPVEPPANLESPAYLDWAFAHGGFGPTTPPDPSAVGMLDLIRQAGLRPRDVMDVEHVTFSDLYSGDGGVDIGLRDALGELTGLPELTGASGSAISAEEFLELYGFDEADVVAARTLMREEMVAFGRDPRAELPPYALTTDEAGNPVYYGNPRYVSTSLPPTAAPEAYYVRLSRMDAERDDHREGYYSTAVRPGLVYAQTGLAPALDYALTTARLALPNMDLGEGRESLGGVIEGGWETRLGRVESCYRNALGTDELTISVYLDADPADHPEEEFLLVRGTAGVACASRATVDGAPCQISDYIYSLEDRNSSAVTDMSFGFPARVQLRIKMFGPEPTDLYLMRRRSGASTVSSGSYDSYGPVYFDSYAAPTGSLTPIFCNAYAVMQGLDKEIYNVMAPSADDPSTPEAACGNIVETRLPLEDELIDDGDAFESSWRHHLAVARAAADQADRLGEELIESGTVIDNRADAANEALMSACGATVNLDGLFGASAGSAIVPGACVDEDGDGEPEGLSVAGSCVRLALEDLRLAADADRDARVLADCLSDDEVVPVVSLGSQPICVWYRTSDAGLICEGATQSNRCPYPATAVEGGFECEPRLPADGSSSAFGVRLVDVNAGLFSTREAGVPGSSGSVVVSAPDCEDVRLMREPAPYGSPESRAAAFGRVRDSNFFSPANVEAWARRLGWEGRTGVALRAES